MKEWSDVGVGFEPKNCYHDILPQTLGLFHAFLT